jgi:hypothetical protein
MLDLINCEIGASGGAMLAEALKVNAVLTNINLLRNMIGTEAATQLSEVLQQHKTLRTLCGITPDQTEADFEGHGLQPVDGVLLAADLKVNAVLTNLNLARNQLCGVDYQGEDTYDATLCTILQLAGCTEKQKHVCVWLNERFESHEFIRRVRPRNVRTWIGIKPRVQLSKCGTCGACCLRRERG